MMEQSEHKTLGIELFNQTWDLLDKKDRSETENFAMINMAHASCYHWSQGGGTPLHEARGEWQISRVYSVLGFGESALIHGQRSLAICLSTGIADFDLAFGYEAVGRAYALLKNDREMQKYIELALEACTKIEQESDKQYALSEINNIAK